MEILIWIISCSLFFDDSLVQSIINVQSSGYQYYIGDSSKTLTSSYPDTLDDAKKMLSEMRRQGSRPLIGLMGIPSELAAKYGRTPEELFDPCVNISVATAILSELATTCEKENFNESLLQKYGALLGYDDPDSFVNLVTSNLQFTQMKQRKYKQMTGDSADQYTKLLEQHKDLVDSSKGFNNNAGIFLDDRLNVGKKPTLRPQE